MGKSGVAVKSGEQGEVTMWGIRTIRVGVFLCGLVMSVAGCGAMNTGVPLIPSRDQSIAPRNLQSQENSGDDKNPERVLNDWNRGGRFQDQPKHLTPERIKGGIY